LWEGRHNRGARHLRNLGFRWSLNQGDASAHRDQVETGGTVTAATTENLDDLLY
jgi:hypothetical protein